MLHNSLWAVTVNKYDHCSTRRPCTHFIGICVCLCLSVGQCETTIMTRYVCRVNYVFTSTIEIPNEKYTLHNKFSSWIIFTWIAFRVKNIGLFLYGRTFFTLNDQINEESSNQSTKHCEPAICASLQHSWKCCNASIQLQIANM